MQIFVLDWETHRIRPSVPFPRPVCAGIGVSVHSSSVETSLELRASALDLLEEALSDPTITLVNHNLHFDLVVAAAERPRLLRPIMDAFDAFRCRCTMIRQILIDIALGESGTDDGQNAFRRENPKFWDFTKGPLGVKRTTYGLADLMAWYFNEHLEKDDTWRLRYGELDGVPLEEWPEDARTYPQKDVDAAFRLFWAQRARAIELRARPEMDGVWESDDGEIPDEANQQRKFALKLMEARGIRTSAPRVFDLKTHYEETKEQVQRTLEPLGMKRKDGSTDTKVVAAAIERVCSEMNVPVDRTPTGQVSRAGDFLIKVGKKAEKWDDGFAQIQEVGKALHLLGRSASELSTVNTWLRWLELGTRAPICPSYWPLVASGRISAREPNVTNPPRKGAIRSCVIARPGHLLMFADFDTAEMRSHAQNCLELLGWSDLAEAFRRGEDPHLSFAADQLGISYAEALRRYEEGDAEVVAARQWAKVPDFGFPGGLGWRGFIEYAAGYGYDITPEEAQRTKHNFERKWRENPRYFELVKVVLGEGREGVLQQLWSRRVRGGLGFTDGCNCVDFETEALTKRGWVNGRELKTTDEVLTKNAETGALEWQRPTDVKLFEATGTPRDLVEFSSKSFSAVTTPDHRWLVLDKRSGKNVCRLSREISTHGDHRIHRTGNYAARTEGIYTDDFVELVGWVLTDGSYRKGTAGSTGIRIYQSKVRTVRDIDALFKRLPFKSRRGKNRELTTWTFTGAVGCWIRELFPNRTLTESFLVALTAVQLRLLLDTMMKGDGHRNRLTDKFYAGSEAQARAFQMLCVLCGLSSRLNYRDMSKYKPRSKKLTNVPKMTGIWIVSILRRDKVQVTTKQKREFKADIGVWCPMVPNTYFVARRRGYTFITGNTMFQGRTADGMYRAQWFLARECYLGDWTYPPQNEDEARRKRNGEPSPLLGSRPLIPMHDETIAEVPDPASDPTAAGRAADRMAYVMRSAMQEVTPDIPALAGAALARAWYKGARAVRVDGHLRPARPVEVEVDGKKKTRWIADE